MALRIIRKSSSQSQVELIKGSAEGKAGFSLLAVVDSAESLAALSALLAHEPIQQHAEVLICRSSEFDGQLRPALPALQHTAKLINESKPGSESLRLRTLIQESASEIAVVLPQGLRGDSLPLIESLVSCLREDASVGIAGPALVHAGKLLAAGQEIGTELPPHSLSFQGQDLEMTPAANELFYLYNGLPFDLWQSLAKGPLQVGGVPLTLAAIRREAYLSLSWADQDWNSAWLAQDLALGLRQKQYRLMLLPQSYDPGETPDALSGGPMPDSFKEKWQPLLRQIVFTLYRHHGWQQRGTHFADPTPPASIQDYSSQKD